MRQHQQKEQQEQQQHQEQQEHEQQQGQQEQEQEQEQGEQEAEEQGIHTRRYVLAILEDDLSFLLLLFYR